MFQSPHNDVYKPRPEVLTTATQAALDFFDFDLHPVSDKSENSHEIEAYYKEIEKATKAILNIVESQVDLRKVLIHLSSYTIHQKLSEIENLRKNGVNKSVVATDSLAPPSYEQTKNGANSSGAKSPIEKTSTIGNSEINADLGPPAYAHSNNGIELSAVKIAIENTTIQNNETHAELRTFSYHEALIYLFYTEARKRMWNPNLHQFAILRTLFSKIVDILVQHNLIKNAKIEDKVKRDMLYAISIDGSSFRKHGAERDQAMNYIRSLSAEKDDLIKKLANIDHGELEAHPISRFPPIYSSVDNDFKWLYYAAFRGPPKDPLGGVSLIVLECIRGSGWQSCIGHAVIYRMDQLTVSKDERGGYKVTNGWGEEVNVVQKSVEQFKPYQAGMEKQKKNIGPEVMRKMDQLQVSKDDTGGYKVTNRQGEELNVGDLVRTSTEEFKVYQAEKAKRKNKFMGGLFSHHYAH
ncbi:hypothetical protein DFH06DRAFT_1405792 [Mycena polygramma]|nr:hypothetical protein DFH06DRAFT_1405792 [Mycena polygramma]